MKRIFGLCLITLAVGCASASPGGRQAYVTPLTRYDVKLGRLEARRSLDLNAQLDRCGRNVDCRARAIDHYQYDAATRANL